MLTAGRKNNRIREMLIITHEISSLSVRLFVQTISEAPSLFDLQRQFTNEIHGASFASISITMKVIACDRYTCLLLHVSFSDRRKNVLLLS